MKTKHKRWSDMTKEELAAAAKQFDDPSYNPPAIKPTKAQLAQLHRVQRRSKMGKLRVSVALEKRLVEQIDDYAATHGMTFSNLVSTALKSVIEK